MGNRTLKTASESGDLDAVRRHLANGADVNATTAAGHFALGGAIINDHIEVVRELIAHGADVNLESEYRWTPLYLAAWQDCAEIAQVLIDAGAKLETATISGYYSPPRYRPLHIACLNGYVDVVKVLIDNGADLNALNGMNSTPLDMAKSKGHQEVVDLLEAHGAVSSRTPQDP